jgi:hypothetical protein
LQALTPPSFNAAMAATMGTASALAGSDRLALGKAGKAGSFGLALVGARNAAKVFFPGSRDKPKHAMMSAAVTGTVSLLTGSRLIGIGTGVAVGLLKECYDGSRFNPHGDRDFHLNGDLGADALGILMGSIVR